MNAWVPVVSVDELRQESGFRFEHGADRVAVFLIGSDVYAIGDRCSHAEASLSDGEVFDGEVECPRHGSAFDLATGKPQSLPATVPVPVYETRVVNGTVEIRIEESP